MDIKEAKEKLSKAHGDDDAYHALFDKIIEMRLEELDKEFMDEMKKIYDESNCCRFYA